MSFVITVPEAVTGAASNLARIGSAVTAANAAAGLPTTTIVAAGEDEVSAAIAAVFESHARGYQALGAQLSTFHDQFVQTLAAGASWYTAAEVAKASPLEQLLGLINAPSETLLGR
jgi:hypothetical protein